MISIMKFTRDYILVLDEFNPNIFLEKNLNPCLTCFDIGSVHQLISSSLIPLYILWSLMEKITNSLFNDSLSSVCLFVIVVVTNSKTYVQTTTITHVWCIYMNVIISLWSHISIVSLWSHTFVCFFMMTHSHLCHCT